MKTYISIAVGTFLAFMLGWLWYGVLFQSQWMSAAGLSPTDVGSDMEIGGMLVPLLAWLVTAGCFHCIAHMANVSALAGNVKLAVLCWLGFALPAVIFSTYFQMLGGALYWIDGIYLLLGALLIALSRTFIRR